METFRLVIEDYTPECKARWRIGEKYNYNPKSAQEKKLAQIIYYSTLQIKTATIPIKCDIVVDITIIMPLYNYEYKKKKDITEITRKRRGDKDNYEKLVMDAITKSGIIGDDKQIISGEVSLVHSDEKKSLIIDFAPADIFCPCGGKINKKTCTQCLRKFEGIPLS